MSFGNGIDWCRVKADNIPVRNMVRDARVSIGIGVLSAPVEVGVGGFGGEILAIPCLIFWRSETERLSC